MTYAVTFDPDALADMAAQFDDIASRADPRNARRYLAALYDDCLGFETFPQRGLRRDDLRPGLRLVGYRRRATIAFMIADRRVVILRIFFAGQEITL